MTESAPKVIGTMGFGDDSVIDVHKVETVGNFVKLTRYGPDGTSLIVQVREDVFRQMFVEEKE